MVLRQNDSVLGQLANFAQTEKIPAANFTGMGFVDNTFGFFDFETKSTTPGI
jgi:predicted DNA-binding protein with PD1-like motif